MEKTLTNLIKVLDDLSFNFEKLNEKNDLGLKFTVVDYDNIMFKICASFNEKIFQAIVKKFTIPVNGLTKQQAEDRLRQMMKNHRENVNFDENTGSISINNEDVPNEDVDFSQEYIKDYWFPEKSTGTKVWMNDIFKEYLVKDVTKITFCSLYPNMIIKLIKNHDIICNVYKFGEMLEFLLTSRKELKKLILETNEKLNREQNSIDNSNWIINSDYYIKLQNYSLLIKKLINFTYGVLSNGGSVIKTFNISELHRKINEFYEYLISKYKDNIIYIDTDTVYFYKFNSNMENVVKTLEVEYDKDEHIDLILFEKKRYVEIQDDKVSKLKFRTYNK